jgi:Transaldolase/Fructose-6-phosphate aldolase
VDGYVSLEVPPDVAYDAAATVALARRLHDQAGSRLVREACRRPNPVGTLPSLNGVSCSSPGVCTAVGSFKTFTGTTKTLAERST